MPAERPSRRKGGFLTRPLIVAPLAFAAGAAAIGAAAVLILGVVGRDGQPEQAFGTLPGPDLTLTGAEAGGVGGGGDPLSIGPPGGAVAWSLAPGLSLPDSASAYTLRGYEFSAATVETIARGLGLAGTVEPVRSPDGTVQGYGFIASEEWCPTPPAPPAPGEEQQQREKYCEPVARLGLSVSGYVEFYAPRVGYELDLSAEAPSEDEAKAVVQQWLERGGLTAGEPFALTSPGVGMAAPGTRRVEAKPLRPEGTLLDYPKILIDVTADGQLLQATSFWASIDAESTYLLRTQEQLLADLQELRGVFNHLAFVGEWPPMCGTSACPRGILDPYRDFSATVERVDVGHTLAAGAGGQQYLVPIYIVHGSLTQEGIAQPAPFTTWVPAVDTLPSALSVQAPNEIFAVAGTLLSPRDTVLFSPPDEFMLVSGSEALSSEPVSGLFYQHVTFSDQAPEQIVEYARRQLLDRGWEPEEPPTVRLVDPLRAPGGEPAQQYDVVVSFVKGDARAAVLVLVNPVWNAGATEVDVVVEER
jgi:hypothetical protein